MTETTALDTTIREPSMTAGEVEMLLFALERSRAQFAWKCSGLDAAALRKPRPPSAMTLGGLIKHLAFIEDCYTARDLTGEMGGPWKRADFEVPDWEWRSAADDSPEDLYALWQGAVERSPSLRRVLVDLHDEYARHVGHADLFREAADGLVGEDPPQP